MIRRGTARDALVRPYEGDLPEVGAHPGLPLGVNALGPALDADDVSYISDLYDAEIPGD